MTLTELLVAIRKHYVDKLVEVIECQERAIAEPVLLGRDGSVVVEGPNLLPLRLDLVPTINGTTQSPIRVDTDDMVSFEAKSFTWAEQMDTRIEPFKWNRVSLQVTGPSIDLTPLIAWFNSWFKSSLESGGSELVHAVHYLSDPLIDSAGFRCEIDIGSAPVDAFENLLGAVLQCGASSVRFGQNAATDGI